MTEGNKHKENSQSGPRKKHYMETAEEKKANLKVSRGKFILKSDNPSTTFAGYTEMESLLRSDVAVDTGIHRKVVNDVINSYIDHKIADFARTGRALFPSLISMSTWRRESGVVKGSVEWTGGISLSSKISDVVKVLVKVSYRYPDFMVTANNWRIVYWLYKEYTKVNGPANFELPNIQENVDMLVEKLYGPEIADVEKSVVENLKERYARKFGNHAEMEQEALDEYFAQKRSHVENLIEDKADEVELIDEEPDELLEMFESLFEE